MTIFSEIAPLIYFPHKTGKALEKFVIMTVDETYFHYKNRNTDNTLVCFAGNGESAISFWNVYKQILDNVNFNILIHEYRGFGERKGQQDLNNLLLDISCLSKLEILVNKRLIVFGRSLGSLPAIDFISKISTESLIIENGIYDTSFWIKRVLIKEQMRRGGYNSIDTVELNKYLREFYDNKNKIGSFTGKMNLFYNIDTMFPSTLEHANRLRKDFEERELTFHLLRYGTHNCVLESNLLEYQSEINKILK